MVWLDEYRNLKFADDITTDDVEQAIQLKFANLPSLLYKYREVNEYALNNLLEDTIWLSDPSNFNDPYDCSFTANYNLALDSSEQVILLAKDAGISIDDELKEKISNSSIPMVILMQHCYPDKPDLAEKMGEAFLFASKERELNLVKEMSTGLKPLFFKVCSFSENPYSILMWSHYARYHQGFCIAYDFRKLGNSDIRTRVMCPVVYSDKLFDASKFLVNGEVRNPLYLEQAALTKSKEWSYEKEWRLIFGNGLFPEEISYKVPKPEFIVLGSKISNENRESLLNICELKNITVKQISMCPKSFNLTF